MNRNVKNDMWLKSTWKTTWHHIIREMQIKITWSLCNCGVTKMGKAQFIPSENVKDRILAYGASDETIKGHPPLSEELD